MVAQVRGLVAGGNRVGDHLHELPRRQALDHGLDGLLGDEGHRPERIELLEVVPVARQEASGHEHQQDVVVSFERGEDVGVRLQRREPVHAHVAGATAALAARLNRLRGVPARGGLHPGGERLQLALLLLWDVLSAEGVMEPVRKFGLSEVQCVGLGQ